jgi:hypothetical protein
MNRTTHAATGDRANRSDTGASDRIDATRAAARRGATTAPGATVRHVPGTAAPWRRMLRAAGRALPYRARFARRPTAGRCRRAEQLMALRRLRPDVLSELGLTMGEGESVFAESTGRASATRRRIAEVQAGPPDSPEAGSVANFILSGGSRS